MNEGSKARGRVAGQQGSGYPRSVSTTLTEHATLGAFLRAKREHLQPDPGFRPSGLRPRRTPGLRREEVAELAGVSIDWYVRLEQNRAPSPSAAVLDSVSRALRLTPAERQYLFQLAGRDPQLAGDGAHARLDAVHPSACAVLGTIDPALPACILGPRLDVLGANAVYDALHLGFGGHPRFGRNIVWFICCDPRAEALLEDRASLFAEAIGALRSGFARHLGHPDFLALIDALRQDCPAFNDHWAQHEVRQKAQGRKCFRHSVAGTMRLEWHSLVAREAPDQLLIVYQPRDDESRSALARLCRT